MGSVSEKHGYKEGTCRQALGSGSLLLPPPTSHSLPLNTAGGREGEQSGVVHLLVQRKLFGWQRSSPASSLYTGGKVL